MTYDAITFDMDGVLLTGYHTDPETYRQATLESLADFDANSVDPPSVIVDPDEAATVREFCERHNVPAEPFWGYREHAATVLENEQIRAGERVPFEDVTVLETLAAEADIGIVSNNRHGTVRFVREYFDWGAHVNAAVGRAPTLSGYDRMKPDPYYLDRVIQTLDTDPADVLFVGDRRSDVETADRAGADAALLVRDGELPAGDAEPAHVIETLDELVSIAGIRE
ncbi:MAG: HAD family hydrolase [archaeon]